MALRAESRYLEGKDLRVRRNGQNYCISLRNSSIIFNYFHHAHEFLGKNKNYSQKIISIFSKHSGNYTVSI